MALTSIEWTAYLNALGVMVPGYTFNAWLGCDKVSPACRICYIARTPALRFRGLKHGDPRERTAPSTWAQPLTWNRKAEREGVRPRVFTNSLADWLDDKVPIEWLADLLDLIRRTPNLDWLLLTKRPQNWRGRLCAALDYMLASGAHRDTWDWLNGWLHALPVAPCNVWIGTTVEDQTRADERIPILLSIPARVRFLSCEPLLGEVSLRLQEHIIGSFDPADDYRESDYLHWIICGGESGPGAHPMHPDWARSIRHQCERAGISFFFKQWGDWQPFHQGTAYMDKFSESLVLPNGPGATGHPVYRVGKKAAGRLLDGRTHDEFPAVVLPQPTAA